MDFRFTLFNSITLFVVALTLWMAYARFRFRLASSWFLAYYVVILGFWKGFDGSLNNWWVAVGLACAVLLRFFREGVFVQGARAVEGAFLGYVLYRGLALLLLW